MIRKLLLSILFAASLISPALAQNTTCSDRPSADSSNACANTRFVQNKFGTGVTSFNGRTGAVTPAINDYNFNQIAGMLASGQLPSPFTNGTASGNTNKFGTTTGTLTSGNCVSIDASGNLVDNGAPCNTSSSNLIYLVNYGYLADNSTDNTTAVNNAIAAAVTYAKPTTIIVPVGIGRVGNTNAITVNNITFKCEGTPGSCIMKGTNTAGMFNIGTLATPAYYFNLEGIGFSGNGVAGQYLIKAVNGDFINLYFCQSIPYTGVTGILQLGTATTSYGDAQIYGLWGSVGNTATPVFSLVKGNGLFVTDTFLYSENASGAAVAGHDFIQNLTTWNTISVRTSFIYLFATALNVNMPTGQFSGDIHIQGNWIDQTNEAILFRTAGTGTIGNVYISQNLLVGKTGSCVDIGGAGPFQNINLNENTIRECSANGIFVFGAGGIQLGSISNNNITQVNVGASGTNCIDMATGSTNVTIVGNSFCNGSAALGPGTAAIGVNIAGGDNFTINSNSALGSVANWSLGTLTNSVVANNRGLASLTGNVTVGASPYTFVAGPRPESVCISGGTVSAITQNSATQLGTSGCYPMAPNSTLTVTYSVAPSMTATTL